MTIKQLKVKDIIKALQKYDPELPVVYASDEEGNSFNRCYYTPSLGKLGECCEFITPLEEGEYDEYEGEECVCIN